jgi:hypothetical protein
MRNLHSDAALRERLSQAGLARAQRFTWAATARSLLGYCQRVEHQAGAAR